MATRKSKLVDPRVPDVIRPHELLNLLTGAIRLLRSSKPARPGLKFYSSSRRVRSWQSMRESLETRYSELEGRTLAGPEEVMD